MKKYVLLFLMLGRISVAMEITELADSFENLSIATAQSALCSDIIRIIAKELIDAEIPYNVAKSLSSFSKTNKAIYAVMHKLRVESQEFNAHLFKCLTKRKAKSFLEKKAKCLTAAYAGTPDALRRLERYHHNLREAEFKKCLGAQFTFKETINYSMERGGRWLMQRRYVEEFEPLVKTLEKFPRSTRNLVLTLVAIDFCEEQ